MKPYYKLSMDNFGPSVRCVKCTSSCLYVIPHSLTMRVTYVCRDMLACEKVNILELAEYLRNSLDTGETDDH